MSEDANDSKQWDLFSCECGAQGNFGDLKAHLEENHNITEFKASRKAISKVESEGWLQYQMEWNIGGVVVNHSVRQKTSQ